MSLTALSFAVLLMSSTLTSAVSVSAPNVITSKEGAGASFQMRNTGRTSFQALGRQWVFYTACCGLDVRYATSDNGQNWQVYDTGKEYTYLGSYLFNFLAAVTNGTHAFVTAAYGYPTVIQLHLGKLASTGAISWLGDFNITGVGGTDGNGTSYLGLDTSNNPFVSFSNKSGAFVSWSVGGFSRWNVLRLDTESGDVTSLTELSDGQMFVAYASRLSHTMFGRLWDGRTWQEEETITKSQFVSASGAGIDPVILYSDSKDNIVAFYVGSGLKSIERTTRSFSTSAWDTPETILNTTESVEFLTITKDNPTGSYFVATYSEVRTLSTCIARINVWSKTETLLRQIYQFSMNVTLCGDEGGFPSLTSDPVSSPVSSDEARAFNIYYFIIKEDSGRVSDILLSQTITMPPQVHGKHSRSPCPDDASKNDRESCRKLGRKSPS